MGHEPTSLSYGGWKRVNIIFLNQQSVMEIYSSEPINWDAINGRRDKRSRLDDSVLIAVVGGLGVYGVIWCFCMVLLFGL